MYKIPLPIPQRFLVGPGVIVNLLHNKGNNPESCA